MSQRTREMEIVRHAKTDYRSGLGDKETRSQFPVGVRSNKMLSR